MIHKNKKLSIVKNQKHIVVIGGGTGTSMVLEGLKKYPVKLTAIVNMFDNGGSSGWLRKELGVLPPGDLRQCARALSGSKIWQKLLEYRFEKGALKGQCFGNFLITVFLKFLNSPKSHFKEFGELSKILNLKGDIIPVSLDKSHLCAKLKSGKILKGENKISASKIISKIGIEKIFLKPAAKANPSALSEIKNADTVVIASGSLYASVLPCFLVKGVSAAIHQSRAKKIYIRNLKNIKGHTDGWTTQNYVKEIEKYIGNDAISAVIHDDKTLALKNVYKQNPNDKLKRTAIRHDPDKLAKIILKLSEK